jgi:hypothetical protein
VSELRVQVEMMVLSAECGWDGRDEDVRAAAGMRSPTSPPSSNRLFPDVWLRFDATGTDKQ